MEGPVPPPGPLYVYRRGEHGPNQIRGHWAIDSDGVDNLGCLDRIGPDRGGLVAGGKVLEFKGIEMKGNYILDSRK